MSQRTPKPPEPVVFFLALVATVGVVLLFLGDPAWIVGAAMIAVSIFGIVWRKVRAKPEHHVALRTSGSGRGAAKRH